MASKISHLKSQLKNEMRKEIARLQAENEKLKNDPEGVIAKFLADHDRAVLQNNRLTGALCAFMAENGGTLTIKKQTIDSFAGKKININFEPIDNELGYLFSYKESTTQP